MNIQKKYLQTLLILAITLPYQNLYAQTFTPTPEVFPLLGNEPIEEPLIAEDNEDDGDNYWGLIAKESFSEETSSDSSESWWGSSAAGEDSWSSDWSSDSSDEE